MNFDELIDKKYNINLIENQHIKTYNELLGEWKVNTIDDYLPAPLRFIDIIKDYKKRNNINNIFFEYKNYNNNSIININKKDIKLERIEVNFKTDTIYKILPEMYKKLDIKKYNIYYINILNVFYTNTNSVTKNNEYMFNCDMRLEIGTIYEE